MISASQDDREIVSCFFEAHEIAAELYEKTKPVVDRCVPQSESESPRRGR